MNDMKFRFAPLNGFIRSQPCSFVCIIGLAALVPDDRVEGSQQREPQSLKPLLAGAYPKKFANLGSQWATRENVSRFSFVLLFFHKGNPDCVLCSVSETNNPDDRGTVPRVKKLQKAPCWQPAHRSGRGGSGSGRDLQIISAAGACRSAPLVVEEACLMCHSFPSVTCLNTHFQTLSLPGGIICCNVGVGNPGVVQPVIHSILFTKKKTKNPGNGNVFRKANLL